MKKLMVYLLAFFQLIALCSCNTLSDLNNVVKYPDSYSLAYEVTSSDGIICTVKKAVDESGNVYYKDSDKEIIFILKDSYYIKYEKNDDGAFIANTNEKYTKKAVEEATDGIKHYAEQSKNKFMPTAKQEDDTQLLGRTCEVFSLGVGTENNNSYTYYHIDKETGICLGVQTKNTVFGQTASSERESFICTELSFTNVDVISKLVK